MQIQINEKKNRVRSKCKDKSTGGNNTEKTAEFENVLDYPLRLKGKCG